MNIDSSKLLGIEIFSVLSILPHVIWLTLYGASRRRPIDARPVLRWLKILRWVGWGFGVALGLLALARGHFPNLRVGDVHVLDGALVPGELAEAPIYS